MPESEWFGMWPLRRNVVSARNDVWGGSVFSASTLDRTVGARRGTTPRSPIRNYGQSLAGRVVVDTVGAKRCLTRAVVDLLPQAYPLTPQPQDSRNAHRSYRLPGVLPAATQRPP